MVKGIFSGGITAPQLDTAAGAGLPDLSITAPEQASAFATAWQDAFNQVFISSTELKDNIASIFQGAISAVSDGFYNLFVSIADGNTNLCGILEGIWQSFKLSLFQVFSEILAKKTVMWTLEKAEEAALALFKTSAIATVSAAESAAVAQSIADNHAHAVSVVADRTAEAQAGFFSAHSIIPFAGVGLALAAIAIMMSSIGAFERGGRPATGQLALVGENGPELFVPDTAGTVIPNSALSFGGGTPVALNQTVHITVSSKDDIKTIAQELEAATRKGVSWAVEYAKTSNRTAQKRDRET